MVWARCALGTPQLRTFIILLSINEATGIDDKNRDNMLELSMGGAVGEKLFTFKILVPQQGELRLSGPPSGQGAGGRARTPDRRVPADLRADLLSTMPTTPPILRDRTFSGLQTSIPTYAAPSRMLPWLVENPSNTWIVKP
ncbi:hypothetical protein PoB_004169800 [Plakobranchus ocellatus]|uniref:Uncharacterized protein n=1 Tax=Plakobranchus ocellatus TaxID=259542 RepID=A0AAV4B8N6_9GAST|nr:hypothetical protein PoB_004169800 [Plakobranchus ocellatus]